MNRVADRMFKYRVLTGKFGSFTTVAASKDIAIMNAAIQHAKKLNLKKESFGKFVNEFKKFSKVMVVELYIPSQKDIITESIFDKLMYVGKTFAPKAFNPIEGAVNWVKGFSNTERDYGAKSVLSTADVIKQVRIFKKSRAWRNHNIHGLWTVQLLRQFLYNYIGLAHPMSRLEALKLQRTKITDRVVIKFLKDKDIIGN